MVRTLRGRAVAGTAGCGKVNVLLKTPFQGEVSIVPDNLPGSAKQELLEDPSARYIWVGLTKPVRQIGREFLFLVLPVKLDSENVLQQCGRGVLCETELEAKESVELLSQMGREHVGVIETAGFGIVGKIKGVRSVITEQSVRSRPGKNGKKRWFALEREIDKATGEVNVLRRQDAKDQAEATSVAKQWLGEYEKRRKEYFNAIAKPNAPSPPPRCKPLTPSDLKDDLPQAKWTALKRQWPRTFELFERRKADPSAKICNQEYHDAYLLDLVEHGYDPKSETIRGDLRLADALAKAGRKFARGEKRKITDAAIYLIAFNYELGWCYLSDAQIAKKLADMLNASFTAEQVEKYRYRTLGLVAKHLSGPPPKSP